MPVDVQALRPRLAAALGTSLQLGEVLGVGGFAAVFAARDPFLERDVAIKVLDPALDVSGELEAQFLREARAIAGVEHPHIVPLYSAESRNGLLYLVMRLLPGQSLAGRMKAAGPMPFDEAARLAHEVAQALATAHERGVVHRDIKPENILLDGAGHATVTDFGIARVTARATTDLSGVSTGTPHYMSPEQALGEEVDGRTDVYSLGVVLFRMLTGALPFDGRNVTELIAKQVAERAPLVSAIRTDTPQPLADLVARMLAKDRAARPTAAEAAGLLAAARTPDALLSPAQVTRKRWRRRMVLFSVAGAAALVVLIGVGYVVVRTVSAIFLGDQGVPPVMSVATPNIPDSALAAARRDSLLLPGETVLYLFVPAGRTLADAMYFTDSAVVRRSANGARRYETPGVTLNINRVVSGDAVRGSVVVRRKGLPPDTLYAGLSGLEVSSVMTGVALLRGTAP